MEYERLKQNAIKKAQYRKKKHKVENMSTQDYRATYLQKEFNAIARVIDFGQLCISHRQPPKKKNGGHYHSVGGNETLALNLHNIHLQSEYSNTHKNGDQTKYRKGLIEEYKEGYAEFVDMTLMQCPPLHLTKEQMISIYTAVSKIRRELDSTKKVLTPNQRIELRNKINIKLGIYPKKFCIFEI
jgi:hypothetical protein